LGEHSDGIKLGRLKRNRQKARKRAATPAAPPTILQNLPFIPTILMSLSCIVHDKTSSYDLVKDHILQRIAVNS
jgi:hypothetical protein